MLRSASSNRERFTREPSVFLNREKINVHVTKQLERVYVLIREATPVVDRTCARTISLELDSTYSNRFQNGSRIIFIDRSEKETTRPV